MPETDPVRLRPVGFILQPETTDDPIQLVIERLTAKLQLVAGLLQALVERTLDVLQLYPGGVGARAVGNQRRQAVDVGEVFQVDVAVAENIDDLHRAEIDLGAVGETVPLEVIELIPRGVHLAGAAITLRGQLREGIRLNAVERHQCLIRRHFGHHRSGTVGGTLVVVVNGQVADTVGGVEQQRHAKSVRIRVIQIAPATQILGISIAILDIRGDAQRYLVGDDRDVDHRLVLLVAVISKPRRQLTVQLVGWRRRRVQQRATGGIATKQRALWPLEHLHRIHVVLRNEAAIVGIGHFGEVTDDGGRTGAGKSLGLAANLIDSVILSPAGAAEHHSRGTELQILRCGNLLLAQRLGGEGRDRHRHRLQAFLGTARRDRNLFDTGSPLRRPLGGLRMGWQPGG